jgi:NCAIR mutase (PurE)-related protein
VLPDVDYDKTARVISRTDENATTAAGKVAVVCAGTSDLPVAEEAAVSLEVLGCVVARPVDVGVAGLQRLLAIVPEIADCQAIIAVAGMEGAMPAVLAGLVPQPGIAVPTSVGYGASFGGLAALLGMLNSCSSGVTVVNIDNGFGAAMAAWKILRAAQVPL